MFCFFEQYLSVTLNTCIYWNFFIVDLSMKQLMHQIYFAQREDFFTTGSQLLKQNKIIPVCLWMHWFTWVWYVNML